MNDTNKSFAKDFNPAETTFYGNITTTNLSARLNNVASNTSGTAQRLFKVKPLQPTSKNPINASFNLQVNR